MKQVVFDQAASVRVVVRNTRLEDFPGIVELSKAVYPHSPPWTEAQLASHISVFPEGQFVAVAPLSRVIVGMAASLIVLWDEYETAMSWRDFTGNGTFSNHDPERGRTLYGAEVMVHPGWRGTGIGKSLYRKRRKLTERLRLLRIRAGARLAGYRLAADRLSAEQYVAQVLNEEIGDPTLSFQLKQGFHVLAVVRNYLRHDPESLGYAAVIEWINRRAGRPAVCAGLSCASARRDFALAAL